MSICGLFALAWSGAFAQDAKIFTIKDFNEGDHANPVCKVARFFSVNQQGKLEWVEKGPFMNSMWYKIPVEGSETDFYLKNVATGQYVYRGYLTEGAVQGDVAFSRNPETKSWNWDFAYLSSTIVEGKEAYFQFRALPARWDWATNLVNVAGAIWENHGVESNPAFGFVINGQHKQTPSISGDITNTGGALQYPAAGLMRCTDNGNQGNAWTVVHFDEVSAATELIKRKVRIENRNTALQYLIETAGGILHWGDMDKNARDLSAWFEIPVDPENPDGDFYLKNASSGKYIYREGKINIPSGGWDREEGLLSAENLKTDAFVFRYVNSVGWRENFGGWSGYGWLANMLNAKLDGNGADDAFRPFPAKGSGLCLHGGTGAQTDPNAINDWFPVAKIGAIDDGGNHWTTIKMDIAAEAMYYSVTFNKANGSANEIKSVIEDGKVTPIATPTRIDYDFLGWSLVQKGTDDGADDFVAYDFDTPVTESFTLYAWWEYAPAPIVERPERKVRILNWGNNQGINSQFFAYAYLGENKDGLLEWIEANPDAVNDYTAWIEVPVEGSNYLNYYKNAATGKYIYMSLRLNESNEPVQTIPVSGAWKWENAFLSENIDEGKAAYYQFWPIIKGDWGGRVHLANMGGVTAENPYTQTGAAFYLGPINSENGGDGFLAYPNVVMSSLNASNGNVWASVLIEPVITQVRIQDWGDGDKPAKYLSVVTEKIDGKDVSKVEWTENDDNYTVWDEMLVDGSTTEYYYRNFGSTSRNHGTGQFLYRETKEFDGDWGHAQALVSSNYAGGNEYYQFRKVNTPDWGGRCWLVNMADAEFDTDGKFIDKKAFVLSGINKDLTEMMKDKPYPAALMHIMPGKDNVWSSVRFSEVAQKKIFVVSFNLGGSSQNVSIPEGDLAECIAEPSQQGFDFRGWFYDADFKEAYNCENPVVVNKNFTLYAKWEEQAPPEPGSCVKEIRIVRIANFTGTCEDYLSEENPKPKITWPRGYMRVHTSPSGNTLMWDHYCDSEGENCSLNENDRTALWYEIPVRGSNFEVYYKHVVTGLYLYLDSASGSKFSIDHETRSGEYKDPGDADWIYKEVKLNRTNYKTDNYKWRVLYGSWQEQGWGASYVANMYKADLTKAHHVYSISGINRNHAGDGYPYYEDAAPVIASVFGDTYQRNGNAWAASSYWVVEEGVDNPDCENICINTCVGEACDDCDLDCSTVTPNDRKNYCKCLSNDKTNPNWIDYCTDSTPEMEYLNNLKAYPNPATDMVTIDGLAGKELITIYDMTGRRVLNTIATGETVQISVNNLPAGTYIIKVSTGKAERTLRVVVMK